MGKGSKWSSKEEKYLLNLAEKYSYNLQIAFNMASIKLNRSKHACRQRYYYIIKHKKTVILSVVTKKGISYNYKNKKQSDVIKTPLIKQFKNFLNTLYTLWMTSK